MRRRSQELQKEASLLPAARAAAHIRDSVYEYPVTLIEGSTGSGKSTQTIQVLLEMQWGNGLAWGIVAQVCPLIEPLVALHSRLEDEMEAWNWIHLATGERRPELNNSVSGICVQCASFPATRVSRYRCFECVCQTHFKKRCCYDLMNYNNRMYCTI
jgi:hypothetical protein